MCWLDFGFGFGGVGAWFGELAGVGALDVGLAWVHGVWGLARGVWPLGWRLVASFRLGFCLVGGAGFGWGMSLDGCLHRWVLALL